MYIFGLVLVWFIVINTTFNNISVISCRSVLLVEETGIPEENRWPVTSHWQTLSHTVVSSTLRLSRFELTTLVMIGPDCTGTFFLVWKFNYHTITTTTALYIYEILEVFSEVRQYALWKIQKSLLLTSDLVCFEGILQP